MNSKKAEVITLTRESRQGRGAPGSAEPAPGGPIFAPLEGLFVIASDEQLEALGTVFCKSPLRKAMTFEAYLVVKGLARDPR